MNSNSDGLSPSLRPLLGVGWNRALPAPFGFDNGFYPDGVNDYFELRLPSGYSTPSSFCIEFYMKFSTSGSTSGVLGYSDTSVSNFFGIRISSNSLCIEKNGGVTTLFALSPGLRHIVVNYRSGAVDFYLDGIFMGSSNSANVIGHTSVSLGSFKLGWSRFNASSGFYLANPIDEFRFYNRNLTQSEVLLNYNGGVGNNPCLTEILDFWYKFEKFETLDFSQLQDNSDLRNGVRDFSGKNSHAQPVNMDTNPASPNYVLKPF